MSSRPASHPLWARRSIARCGVVVLATFTSGGLVLPAASADTAASIPIDPGYVELSIPPNSPPDVYAGEVTSPLEFSPFQVRPAAWGGSLDFYLPEQVVPAGAGLQVSLDLQPSETGDPTRTYSSDSADPADALTLTDLGNGGYEVDLPADDGVNGPIGVLTLSDLMTVSGDPDVVLLDPVRWTLDLTAGPSSSGMILPLVADAPACDGATADCTSTTVTAGDSFTVTLPTTSKVYALGARSFTTSAFSITPVAGGTPVALAAAVAGDGSSVSLVVPAETAAGRFVLDSVITDGTPAFVASVESVLDVVAATDVVTATNVGLTSETGWEEHVDPAGSGAPAPVLVVSAVSVVVGAGGALALRSRRRAEG